MDENERRIRNIAKGRHPDFVMIEAASTYGDARRTEVEKTYRIMRYFRNASPQRLEGLTNLTLEQALPTTGKEYETTEGC